MYEYTIIRGPPATNNSHFGSGPAPLNPATPTGDKPEIFNDMEEQIRESTQVPRLALGKTLLFTDGGGWPLLRGGYVGFFIL